MLTIGQAKIKFHTWNKNRLSEVCQNLAITELLEMTEMTDQ